jgi:hypothetical protein
MFYTCREWTNTPANQTQFSRDNVIIRGIGLRNDNGVFIKSYFSTYANIVQKNLWWWSSCSTEFTINNPYAMPSNNWGVWAQPIYYPSTFPPPPSVGK